MYNMLCKSCYCTWTVSEREVARSDNSWFYCTNCGSGNTEVVES